MLFPDSFSQSPERFAVSQEFLNIAPFLNPFLQNLLEQDWSSPIKKQIKSALVTPPPCAALLLSFSLNGSQVELAGTSQRNCRSGNRLAPNKEQFWVAQTLMVSSIKHWGFISLLPCTCISCCHPLSSSNAGIRHSQLLLLFYLPCCTESQTTSLWGDTGLHWQQTAKPGWLSEGWAGSGHQQWSTSSRQYFSSNAALTAWASKDFSVGMLDEQDITSLQNRFAFWIQVFQLAQNLCLHYV